MRKWLMNCWVVKCIKAVGSIILYFLAELKSLKVVVMIFLCYLMAKGIDSVALQITIPIVFGFLFQLRYQQKASGKLLNGDTNGTDTVDTTK